jgi:hypothetical protein
MRALDALHYLLSYGVGESGMNPPAYLIHNLIDDKGYLTTLENCYKKLSMNSQPNVTQLPFSLTKPIIPSREFTTRKESMISSNGGLKNAVQFFNYKFSEYDQEERLWESFDINKSVLNDLLTKGQEEASDLSMFMTFLNEDLTQSRYYKMVPHSHPLLYDIMRSLELHTSNLNFYIDGNMELDVGQIVNVSETGVSDATISQFHGRWLIKSISHTFGDQQYYSNLTLCRRFFKKYTPTVT